MENLLYILTFLVGLVVAAIVTWLVLRGKSKDSYEKGKSEAEADHAALIERISNKDRQIDEQRISGQRLERELEEIRRSLGNESDKRSAAEERNSRIPELEEHLRSRDENILRLRNEIAQLREKGSELVTRLQAEQKASNDKTTILTDAQQKLSDAFKALSADALKNNNQSFLDLARTTLEKFHEGAKANLESREKAIEGLVKPLGQSLEKFDVTLRQIEATRSTAYTTLTEQIKSLAASQTQLNTETGNLVKALRAPIVRGRWGEIQLRRVVEIAGMVNYCDFREQETITTEDGRQRPDMIVNLPGGKRIVIDSKAPLEAYLDALESKDDTTRIVKLKTHALQIRNHINKLSSKAYWEQFQPAPEFVVLFLPGETFFSAALEQDPGLIEFGVDQNVIIATPITLIALLRAIAYGWRQEQLAENAQVISNLGKTLYDRIFILSNYFVDLRKGLLGAVDAYNSTVGSLERRVLVAARRFKELGAASDESIQILDAIDTPLRILDSGDMLEAEGVSDEKKNHEADGGETDTPGLEG